jgi:hypothetical protein
VANNDISDGDLVFDWITKHPSDPLVGALRVLASSSAIRYESAFSQVFNVIADSLNIGFCTHVDASEAERKVREWFKRW